MIYIRCVVGNSMLPTLAPDTIVIAIAYRQPKVGDIVMAKRGAKELIKRVSDIAQGGHSFFLLGDNSRHSTDSRHFGRVERKALLGIVVWPRTLKKTPS